ncbi:hypothetical protein F4808DRAFT_156744 [Astrocystis sublimbata]|nr:hypothetical protein F4808DRAFT_156744 [Astrocystis sublimbata]
MPESHIRPAADKHHPSHRQNHRQEHRENATALILAESCRFLSAPAAHYCSKSLVLTMGAIASPTSPPRTLALCGWRAGLCLPRQLGVWGVPRQGLLMKSTVICLSVAAAGAGSCAGPTSLSVWLPMGTGPLESLKLSLIMSRASKKFPYRRSRGLVLDATSLTLYFSVLASWRPGIQRHGTGTVFSRSIRRKSCSASHLHSTMHTRVAFITSIPHSKLASQRAPTYCHGSPDFPLLKEAWSCPSLVDVPILAKCPCFACMTEVEYCFSIGPCSLVQLAPNWSRDSAKWPNAGRGEAGGADGLAGQSAVRTVSTLPFLATPVGDACGVSKMQPTMLPCTALRGTNTAQQAMGKLCVGISPGCLSLGAVV